MLTALCAPLDVLSVSYNNLQSKLKTHYFTKPIKLASYHNLFMLRKLSAITYHDLMIKVCSFLNTGEWLLIMERAGVLVFTMPINHNKLRSKLLQADMELMDTALQMVLQHKMIDKAALLGSHPTTSSKLLMNQVRGQDREEENRCNWCGSSNHEESDCNF